MVEACQLLQIAGDAGRFAQFCGKGNDLRIFVQRDQKYRLGFVCEKAGGELLSRDA